VIIHNLTGVVQTIDLSTIGVNHVIYSFDESVIDDDNILNLPAYASVVLE
jgi:hypothetical protein